MRRDDWNHTTTLTRHFILIEVPVSSQVNVKYLCFRLFDSFYDFSIGFYSTVWYFLVFIQLLKIILTGTY